MGENALAESTPIINITIRDFASQLKLGSLIATGSFGDVHRCTLNEGKEEDKEVAVKVFKINDRKREKLQIAMEREVAIWLELSKSEEYIVPLLGIAKFSPESLPALVSEWMPSETLDKYLKNRALVASARVELTKGVAGGVNYLRLKNVIHGDLHPGNVLIDCKGNPRLTDFGLATVVGDPELQWGTTTAARELNARWRAPEVLGIRCEVARPTFMSDIYSLGSIMFFIISGDKPWKEKKNSAQISVELWNKATPTRPENILNGPWNSIQKCWSWEPKDRPEPTEVLQYIEQFGIDDSQASILNHPVDLTGQIIGHINGLVPGGTFANVYRCEFKQASRGVEVVAVKVIKFDISDDELERLNHETKTWAVLKHNHIIRLLGTARDFGPSQAPALVFPWFENTLPDVITKQGAKLSIRSKLYLLLGTASGLEYLHGLGIVHGDVTSSNVLVDKSEGKYHACLTDIGLATILGGRLGNRVIHGSHVRLDAVRWTAPELLKGGSPTKENDMYSFGCVMFHLLTLHIPWHTISDDFTVVEHIRRGEHMSRPALSDSPDLTDARWNVILKCWSAVVSRPSASMAIIIDLLKSELKALSGDASTDDDTSLRGEERSYRQAPSGMFNTEHSTAPGYVTHPTREEGPPPSSNTTSQITFRALRPLPFGPNVLLFGETGVDKNSIISLIVGQNIADTAPDASHSRLKHVAEVSLSGRRFEFWEVSLTASMGFVRRSIAKWRLRASCRRLHMNGGAPLLLYCMRGPSAPAASRDYQDFTDIVGSTNCVSIALVVDGLEEPLTNMDDWRTTYEGDLRRLGMQFSHHAYITSLPNDPNTSRSREIIGNLFECYVS